MDVDALANLRSGWPGLARLVAALGREHVALEALCSQEFSQVGQVLGGRGVIGPVILIDEENSREERAGRWLGPGPRGLGTGFWAGSRPIQPDVESECSEPSPDRFCPGGCLAAATGDRSPFHSAGALLQALVLAGSIRCVARAAGEPHILLLWSGPLGPSPVSPGRATLWPRCRGRQRHFSERVLTVPEHFGEELPTVQAMGAAQTFRFVFSNEGNGLGQASYLLDTPSSSSHVEKSGASHYR